MKNRIKIIKSPEKLTNIIKELKKRGKSVGFVPTMGALHNGHFSLIKKARKENDIVVVSIFVNPTQFGPNEDYKNYPRTFKEDKENCLNLGVDIIFAPTAEKLYPEGYKTFVEVKDLSDILCGKFRPGHFKGVATIVLKLFNIVQPDTAYFGLKDYQQFVIINKMVKDLNLNIKIKGVSTVREKDGLALSSRNKYLNEQERKEALLLYKSLKSAEQLIKYENVKNSDVIKKNIKNILLSGNIIKNKDIDYIAIVDAHSLAELKKIKGDVLIALAVHLGKARLIDNIVIRKVK